MIPFWVGRHSRTVHSKKPACVLMLPFFIMYSLYSFITLPGIPLLEQSMPVKYPGNTWSIITCTKSLLNNPSKYEWCAYFSRCTLPWKCLYRTPFLLHGFFSYIRFRFNYFWNRNIHQRIYLKHHFITYISRHSLDSITAWLRQRKYPSKLTRCVWEMWRSHIDFIPWK